MKIKESTFKKVYNMKNYIEKKYKKNFLEEKEKSNRLKKINKIINNLEIDSSIKNKLISEYNKNEILFYRKKRTKITIKNYIPIKLIGKGAFGEVKIYKSKENNEIVAIKKLLKSDIINKKQIFHLKAERDILVENDNEWIVGLKCCFSDEYYLYLVMEYLPGGDLMSLLIKKQVLSEKSAKFYIAEIIECIENVHKMNYIHRDIKPDNIVIDKNGHLKLIDFGLCSKFNISSNLDYIIKGISNKKNKRNQLKSLVGTPDYIAPEIFQKLGYNQVCDFWSIGIILFEMVVGYPPFISKTQEKTYFKIINWQRYFKIPKEVKLSKNLKDLIKKLINFPEIRLGKNGINEIKNHPFFKGIDWKNLKKTKAPFIPKLSSDYDNKYFDDFKESNYIYNVKKSKNISFKDKLLFFDFNYKKNLEIEKKNYFNNFVKSIDNKIEFFKSLDGNNFKSNIMKTININNKNHNFNFNENLNIRNQKLKKFYKKSKNFEENKSKKNIHDGTDSIVKNIINNIKIKNNVTNKIIINFNSPSKKFQKTSNRFKITSKSPRGNKKVLTFNSNKKLI